MQSDFSLKLANPYFIKQLPGRKSDVKDAHWISQCVLSIISDNGSEFYEHKRIAKYLDANYFFAHPYSSWERGLMVL
jgi:IS30 family transposase